MNRVRTLGRLDEPRVGRCRCALHRRRGRRGNESGDNDSVRERGRHFNGRRSGSRLDRGDRRGGFRHPGIRMLATVPGSPSGLYRCRGVTRLRDGRGRHFLRCNGRYRDGSRDGGVACRVRKRNSSTSSFTARRVVPRSSNIGRHLSRRRLIHRCLSSRRLPNRHLRRRLNRSLRRTRQRWLRRRLGRRIHKRINLAGTPDILIGPHARATRRVHEPTDGTAGADLGCIARVRVVVRCRVGALECKVR